MKKIMMAAVVATALGLGACATKYDADVSVVDGYAMGRSIPERISDGSIELLARRQLSTIAGVDSKSVRVAIDSYRREVLLTGEVASADVKAQIEQSISALRDVSKVYNYLTISDTPKSQSHTVHENYLRSKIVTRVLSSRQVRSSQYKIIVRDRTAYILGHVTPAQQDVILQAVEATSGMESAVTLTTLVQAAGDLQPYAASPQGAYLSSQPAQPVLAPPPAPTTYTIPEIYTPAASTNAPINAAPVLNPPYMPAQ